MKTAVVIILGLIVIAIIVTLILVKILKLAFGAIFILLAIILMVWLYNRVKDKLDWKSHAQNKFFPSVATEPLFWQFIDRLIHFQVPIYIAFFVLISSADTCGKSIFP